MCQALGKPFKFSWFSPFHKLWRLVLFLWPPDGWGSWRPQGSSEAPHWSEPGGRAPEATPEPLCSVAAASLRTGHQLLRQRHLCGPVLWGDKGRERLHQNKRSPIVHSGWFANATARQQRVKKFYPHLFHYSPNVTGLLTSLHMPLWNGCPWLKKFLKRKPREQVRTISGLLGCPLLQDADHLGAENCKQAWNLLY